MSKGQLAGIPNYLMKKIGEGGGGQPRASLTDVIIPLLVEDWVENEDGDFVQTVAVNGLGAGNNPVVLLYTDAEEYTDEELEAYCRISDINVTQDAITFIASRKPSISFAVIAKSVTDVEGTEVALNRVIEKIDELTDIAVPLMVSDWAAEGDTFVQNITVNGLGTSNVPVIALSTVNEIASEAELDSYSCISDVIVTEGNIKFIASEMPSISFTVVVKGVVASENNTVADITALVGRVSELEEANSKLNSDIEWKSLVIPTPTITNNNDGSKTYKYDFSANELYKNMKNKEILVNIYADYYTSIYNSLLWVSGAPQSLYYTDGNAQFMGKVSADTNSVTVVTFANSSNIANNPLVLANAKVK